MKKIKVDARYLKKRLIISFCIVILFLVFSVFTFKYIQNSSTKIEGTPVVLRRSFEWNEKVWSKLNSKKRLSIAKPPPAAGDEPRVNGDIGLEDEVDVKNYSIEVLKENKKIIFPLALFYSLPKVGYSTEFRCIEGWSEDIQYAGARFSDFLALYNLGKKADGTYYNYVGLETPDKKYYVSIDMESMLHPQTVLAYEMNGQVLSDENGAPIRLIIPVKYGIKNIKRIGKIFFSDLRPSDYWTEKGYDWYSGF
ncbi:MAG: molybdopterin-dependent oxidoreductase [Bacteriovorax sp.]|nr:molybdopterin-dependent oxidoreductase [Bacteriovorax sp.]